MQKYRKATDKTAKCEECRKCFHVSCANLSEKELSELGSQSEAWYCRDYKAECDLCSGTVLNDHKVVQCDKCEMWVHNDCKTKQNSSCTWICPKCEFFNLSDSFFSEQLNLVDQNTYSSLAKDGETRTSSTGTKNNNSVSGLKFSSINVNGIRSKKLELLVYLDFHQPQIVAIQETKNDSSIYLQICFQKLVRTMYTERTETLRLSV